MDLKLKLDETEIVKSLEKIIADQIDLNLSRVAGRITHIIDQFEETISKTIQSIAGLHQFLTEWENKQTANQIAWDQLRAQIPEVLEKLDHKIKFLPMEEKKRIAEEYHAFRLNPDCHRSEIQWLKEHHLTKANATRYHSEIYGENTLPHACHNRGRRKGKYFPKTIQLLSQIHHILQIQPDIKVRPLSKLLDMRYQDVRRLVVLYKKCKTEQNDLYKKVVEVVVA